MTSQHTFKSSTSEGSAVNSVDCDSGAHDLFGDALTLRDLSNTYPELYRFMLQTGSKIESPESSTKNSDSSWTNPAFTKEEAPFESDSDVAFAQLFGVHDSSNSLLTIRRAMSSIFDCLNAVHVQKTSKLRMEIRDLCCRLQGLQASREQDQHEIYRLQRERDRFRRDLAHQAARYEDRITELHSVLAELKRKLERSNAVTSVGGGMAVQDLVEVSDDDEDVDNEDVEDDADDDNGDQVDGRNTGKQDQLEEHPGQSVSRTHFSLLSDWENNGAAAAVGSFGSLVEFSYSPLIANGANMAGGLIHSEPEDLMTSHNSVAFGNASLDAQSCLAQSSIVDGEDHAKSPHNCQPNQTSGGWKQPATVKHDLRGSPLSFLSDRRAVGNGAKPVMGLRQQNQARKTRMALKLNQQQQQLGCGEVNLNRAASHLSQQISEPPLTYHSSDSVGNERLQGTGLTKASSCEDRIRQSTPSITSTTSSAPVSSPVTGDIGQVNGLETEPTWVFNCLSRCQGADRDCLSPRGPRKPGAAPTAPEVWQAKETAPVLVYGLLSGLAQTAPYPRLAEAAHRALLALEQRDTAAASREAELLGLEASLAEAKASGDQLQCRLGQIESSWSAAMRASELADLALETGNILMHLYASELALVLHKRWTPERDPRTRAFSSLSSSSSDTSSSSEEDAAGTNRDHPNSQRLTRKVTRAPSSGHVRTKPIPPAADAATSTAHHPLQPVSGFYDSSRPSNVYAVYALPKSSTDDGGLSVSLPTYILPHEACNGPACPRLLRIQRHQAEMAAIRLLHRVTLSADATYLKSESLPLTDESDLSQRHARLRTDVYESIGNSSMSVYVNSWYVGHAHAAGPRRPQVGCAGDDVTIACFAPASNFAASGGQANGVRQSSTNQHSTVNSAAAAAVVSGVPRSIGGWQTPDSGACSCSTNDASGSAATSSGLPLPSNVQCAYPPGACTSMPSGPGGTSVSSSSSTCSSVGPRASPTASGWNRSQEFLLLQLFEQLRWERAMVRSTIAEFPAFHPTQNQTAIQMPEHPPEAVLYANNVDGGRDVNGVTTVLPAPSKRLNALALVEVAALVQDLCAVKEERAKLKVQNYIMDKELRALQLSLQSRRLSESMLRSQLAAVLQGDQVGGVGPVAAAGKAIEANREQNSLFTTLDSLRTAVEAQRYQNEDLISDLKQANAALITAFEKAKSKYLARIQKLEEQVRTGAQPLSASGRGRSQSVSAGAANAPKNGTNQVPATGLLACRPPTVPQHAPKTPTRAKNDWVASSGTPVARPPLPASPQASDVYEVIQDSQPWYPSETVCGQVKMTPVAPNCLQQHQLRQQQPLPAPNFYRPALATPPPRPQSLNSFQPQLTKFYPPPPPSQLTPSTAPLHSGSLR